MARLFTFSIPAKPHIAQFTHQRIGQPVFINNDTAVGSMCIALLQKKTFNTQLDAHGKHNHFLNYTSRIFLAMPVSQYYHLGSKFNQDHIIHINRFLQLQFEESLRLFVDTAVDHRQRYRNLDEVLELFAAKWSLEIDHHISYDNLKKIEYRTRKKSSVEALKICSQNRDTFWPVLSVATG